MQLGKRLANVWPWRDRAYPQRVYLRDGQTALLTAPLHLSVEGRCWHCTDGGDARYTVTLEAIEDNPVLCLVHAEATLTRLFRSSDDPRWYQVILRALAQAMEAEEIDAEYA